MKKNIEKLFSRGNKINISIKAYATLYNRFLDRIESKKDRYSFDKVNQQNQQGKGPRPIVIIWSNKFHDKVIACSETTSKTNYNKKYSYKVSINSKIVYWKYEVLILEKQKTNVVDNHIWNKYSQEVIIDFLKEWKKQDNSKRAYDYFERLKLKYDNEAKQKYINELLKLTSK